jgi:hypothetical protein
LGQYQAWLKNCNSLIKENILRIFLISGQWHNLCQSTQILLGIILCIFFATAEKKILNQPLNPLVTSCTEEKNNNVTLIITTVKNKYMHIMVTSGVWAIWKELIY